MNSVYKHQADQVVSYHFGSSYRFKSENGLLTEYALLLILIGLSAIKKVGSQQP